MATVFAQASTHWELFDIDDRGEEAPDQRPILSRAWRLRPYDRRGLVQLTLAFGFARGPAAAVARPTRRFTRSTR